MVRQLSEAPECFLFDCCILIARFTSLSCYSLVNTRIRLVKSFQINKWFCSITHCALLHIVYCLIAVLTCLRCPEFQSLPCEFTALLLSPNPNLTLNLHLDHHFRSPFPIVFSYEIHPVLTLWTCKCMQVPFIMCVFYSDVMNLLSLATALLLLAQ